MGARQLTNMGKREMAYVKRVVRIRVRDRLQDYVIQEWGLLCKYCGVPLKPPVRARKWMTPEQWDAAVREGERRFTTDHVIPINKGGANSAENIVPCCCNCNSGKGGRYPHEAGMKVIGGVPWACAGFM